MPPPGRRGTMILRRPRVRPPDRQEPSTSKIRASFPPNDRPLSQSERNFSTSDRSYYQDRMPFHSDTNLNFNRGYPQGYSVGEQKNKNFRNSAPQSMNFPSYSEMQAEKIYQYPQNSWEAMSLPLQNGPRQALPFQNQPSGSRSMLPFQNQPSTSQQARNTSQTRNTVQYTNTQYQNRNKRNTAQTNPQINSRTVENKSVSNTSQELKEINDHYKSYICPGCNENYTFKHHQNKLIGKLPLILHCSHTVCQECIYKKLSANKIICPVCQHESMLTRQQTPVSIADLQKPFQPNLYILGMMFYTRPPGGFLNNLDNIKLVSNTQKKNELPPVAERCCFGTCTKEAAMFCPECDGIFCTDCGTVVHKSTKLLMCHLPVPLKKKKFSFKLDNCSDHPQMLLEFYCKECDSTTCCYCALDHHNGHERVPLYQLTDNEKEEFQTHKERAITVLKEVLAMQKKASKLTNFTTSNIKKEIAGHFADRHAKLYTMEKKLFDEISEIKTSTKGLESIQSNLKQTADVLKQLIKFDPQSVSDQKLNLKGALKKLKEIENEPRFLLNNEGTAEPVRFVNKFSETHESESYAIVKSDGSEYKLVTKDELPEDYVFEESLSAVESDIEQLTKKSGSLRSGLSVLDDNKIRYQASVASKVTAASIFSGASKQGSKKSGMEKVEVQHINSMDSFFVQYKNMQSKLNSLNKDIENYVKMGGAESIKEPELNTCYLILYIVESQGSTREQKWCRGKVVDVKNAEVDPLYEAFFIDYGKTQFVKVNRIKDIPQFLLKSRPFAVECRLYNPTNVNWNKNAHFTLAKVLNGKQIFMVVKSTEPTGVLVVDLMVSSSDGSVTSVIDILVYTTNNSSNDEATSNDGTSRSKKDVYCPQLKVFPNSKRFTKNQTDKVVLANVIDPHNVFVHVEAHRKAFKNMAHLIKKAYKHSKNESIVPVEGTYVLLEHRDPIRSNWHRGFIKSVDLNTDRVHAVLVDWGLTVMVPTSSVRPMQECFTKLEAQAVLVKLAHIAPFNKQAMWPTHATTFLQTYLAPQEVLKMVVHDVDNEVNVALFDINGNVPVCINAQLVEQNLADSTGPVSTKIEWPQYDAEQSFVHEEDGILASMLRKVDEAESDSGEEDCRHVSRLPVEIVKAVSPDELYVKFVSLRVKEAELFRELNVCYGEAKDRVTKTKWAKDDACVLELVNEFSRGKILAEIPGGYRVFLYDKAEEVDAITEKLYVYNNYFAQFPNVAIRCHLANIRPAGDTGKWSISSIEALQEIFQKRKRLFAHKVDEAENTAGLDKKSMPLDMWYAIVIPGSALEPDVTKYVSINQSLIRLGFAYKKPGVVNSFEQVLNALAEVPKEDEIKRKSGNLNETDDNKSSVETKSITQILKRSKVEPVVKIKKEDTNKKKIVNSSDGETSTSSSSKTVITKSRKSRKVKKNAEKSVKIDEKSVKIHEKSAKIDEKLTKTAEKSSKKGSSSETEADSKEVKQDECVLKRPSPVEWIAIVEAEENKQEQAEQQPSTSGLSKIVKSDESPGGFDNNSDEDETSDNSEKEEDNQRSPYHRKEVDISDWLAPFRLTRREFRARVTCVETSGHLFLHDESIHVAYEQIEENIKAYFDTNPPRNEDVSYWQPGRLCTIKYHDGKWYRGRVLKVIKPDLISVLMIDFASDHLVSPDALYREVLYTDIEAFATQVRLDKVYAKNGVWLSSDYDALRDLVTDWCQIKVNGPINVEAPLVEVINERGVNINEELVRVSQNLVKQLTAHFESHSDQEEELLVIEEEVQDACSDASSEKGEAQNERVCQNDSRASSSGEMAEQLVGAVSCNSILDWKFKRLPLPFKGENVVLEVGGVLGHNKVALKECGENVSEIFYNLIIDIQDSVDVTPQLTDLKVGVPCLAPYSEDGVWYRARISNTDHLEFGKVEVYFVDYGNSECVNVTDVHAIRRDWLEYPQQTWEVKLAFELNSTSDLDEVYEMISLLIGKQKSVKFVCHSPLTVDLYDKDVLCYQNLVDLGLIVLDPKD